MTTQSPPLMHSQTYLQNKLQLNDAALVPLSLHFRILTWDPMLNSPRRSTQGCVWKRRGLPACRCVSYSSGGLACSPWSPTLQPGCYCTPRSPQSRPGLSHAARTDKQHRHTQGLAHVLISGSRQHHICLLCIRPWCGGTWSVHLHV